MVVGFRADAQSHVIGPFGQQDGCTVGARVVRKSDSKVLRIGDDDVRLLDLLHHSGVSHFALTPADLGFYLGAPFHVFHLVLDFLLRHAHALHEREALVWHIDHGNKNKAEGQPESRFTDQGPGQRKGWLQGHGAKHEQFRRMSIDQQQQNHRDNGNFQQGFEKFHSGRRAKHPLQSRDGV